MSTDVAQEKRASDTTEKILYWVRRISADLEQMDINDHASVVEHLRVLTQRRAIAIQQRAQEEQMRHAINSARPSVLHTA